MAANLTGMFAQLNKAIGENPLVTGTGDNLITGISQNIGGAAGGLMGSDPYGFMTDAAKEQQGKEDLASLNLQTAQGMGKAAKLYQKMGDPEKAVLFANKSKEMAKAEAKNVTTQRVQSSLLDMVTNDNTLTQEDRDYYNAAIVNGDITSKKMYQDAKLGKAGGDPHFHGGTKTVKDSMGNKYIVTTVSDPQTGVPTNNYAVIGEGPAEPVGNISIISDRTGLSGADTHDNRLEALGHASTLRMNEDELAQYFKEKNIGLQEQSDIRKARASAQIDQEAEWQTARNDIVMNIPNVNMAAISAQKALDLLSTNDTSGIISSIANIKNLLGVGNTESDAKLNQAMSSYVLENLRKMGANPTEGERKFLIDAAANIGRGTEANVALFEKTLKRLKVNSKASMYLLDNPQATRDQYVREYNKVIRRELEQPTVKLGDIQ